MSLEARMRTIAREAIATGPAPASPDVSELQQQINDLHKELHAVATRLTALEQQAEPKTGDPQSETVPAARRARKATSE